MLLRSATTLLLAALLIFQSVVPCCAIGKLPAGGESSDAATLQVSRPCSCCPHSLPQDEPIPLDDGHSPDGKCPFCGGLLFHSALDDVATAVTDVHQVFACLGDAPEDSRQQAPKVQTVLQRQVLGQPFLNIGMRLLI